jgi:spore germination protein KC
MKRSLILLMLTAFLLLGGCQSRDINLTVAILGLGVDLEKDNIKFSAQVAKPIPPEKAGEQQAFTVVSGSGVTGTEAARNISLSVPRLALWSQASVVFLGESLVRKDLALISDLLARNTDVRKSARVFICKDATPEEIMQAETPLDPYSASAMNNLLSTQERQLGIYLPVRLGDFIYALTTPGVEPLVPQLTLEKQGDKTVPALKGTAVFKGQRMVGSLNENESIGYRWMYPKIRSGGLIIIPSPIDRKGKVTLELIRSSPQIEAKISGNDIRMQIKIEAEGNFYEQNFTGPVLTPENIKKMENLANQEISHQCYECIRKAQALNSDVFGWGRIIESSYPQAWKQLEPNWDEVFPKITADITVEFAIRRTYLTDRSFVFR